MALITFCAPALNIKAREKWMGWTPRQRTRRLSFVVNNSRFLVLPDRNRYPNLASRVLGPCLKRLNADWKQEWGHPLLLVESVTDAGKVIYKTEHNALGRFPAPADHLRVLWFSFWGPSASVVVSCSASKRHIPVGWQSKVLVPR